MKPVIANVRGKQYFTCDYTGAPITIRYYVPGGKGNKAKQGCYATLPILLRHQFELMGSRMSEEFEFLKKNIEQFYNQPDIPLAPELSLEAVPLSEAELLNYMNTLDTGMGCSWFLVPKGVTIEEALPKKKSSRKKAKVEEEEELPPTQLLE